MNSKFQKRDVTIRRLEPLLRKRGVEGTRTPDPLEPSGRYNASGELSGSFFRETPNVPPVLLCHRWNLADSFDGTEDNISRLLGLAQVALGVAKPLEGPSFCPPSNSR